MNDILQRVQAGAAHLLNSPSSKKLASIEISPLGSVSWDNNEIPANWRTQITNMLNELEKTNTGVLFAIDEVDGSLDEMIQLVTVFKCF